MDSDPVSTHTGAMTEVTVEGPDVNETGAEWSAENAASDRARHRILSPRVQLPGQRSLRSPAVMVFVIVNMILVAMKCSLHVKRVCIFYVMITRGGFMGGGRPPSVAVPSVKT